MREQQPMTQTMKASEARQHFASVLNRVFRKEARVVVEKSGIPVAAIISAADLERLTQLEQEREQRWAAFLAIADRFPKEDPDEAERFVAEEIEAMRAEERAQAAAQPRT